MKEEKLNINKYIEILESHFDGLPDQHTIELMDGFSRILFPINSGSIELDQEINGVLKKLINKAKYRHVNYHTFKTLFEHIGQKIKTPVILETGSSAHGTNSSLLFGSLAKFAGGNFVTVDINPQTVSNVKKCYRKN
jgi:hypothetical protein